ncbi:unnamed protein product [Spodoptera littoralis]|uniref:Uncharacterized protein n=1 Tax=Spodoptera littoralis TaxID=7109 RepID=A0A9P0IDC6_SPOLI|nr:unnamed protein product [Spodoptera littoralis]CAH1644144.1 unnamed protein product [Spodoptera littoralis]
MWRCTVLLSVCCVGLAASQGLLDGFNPFRVHMGPACREYEVYTECTNPCVNDSCEAMGSLKPNCTNPVPCTPGCDQLVEKTKCILNVGALV